jgi:hypothetical protein
VNHIPSIDLFLAELERLAQLVARMPDLILQEGDAGSGWSFNRRDRVIRMDGSRLRSESRDFNRGLVIHELSHAVLTRLVHHLDGDYLSRHDIYGAINALEDIRVESWILERFVGARKWVVDYNGKLLNNTVPEFTKLEWTQLPPLQAFLAAVMARWWWGDEVKIPEALAPLVEEAWPHVGRIRKAIPGPCSDGVPGSGIADDYRRSTVRGLYSLRDTIQPPDEFEMEVRLKQAEFWAAFEEGILPIIKRLAPPDLAPPPSGHPRSLPALFRRWSRSRKSDESESFPIGNRVTVRLRGKTCLAHGPGNEDPLPWEPNLPAYLKSAQLQAADIQRLSNLILSIFPPRGSRKWEGPRDRGQRIRIRSVPQSEADPRKALKVWERHSPPTRAIPHIAVLIDRSGSMEGERMTAALSGCVLASEVCHKAGIPFSLFTFSNRCEQVIGWETVLDDVQRGRMGGLAKAAAGGTRMADALRKAGDHMTHSPHHHRVLVVLGDGDDGDDQAAALARRILQSGIHLVGLGVGPDTAAMGDCIPNARTGLKPAAIPGAFAAVLEQAVLERRSGGAPV